MDQRAEYRVQANDIDQGTLVALMAERERLDGQIKAMGNELAARRRDSLELREAVARLREVLVELHPRRADQMMSEPLVVIEAATDYLAAVRDYLTAATGGDNGRTG